MLKGRYLGDILATKIIRFRQSTEPATIRFRQKSDIVEVDIVEFNFVDFDFVDFDNVQFDFVAVCTGPYTALTQYVNS